MEVFFNPPLDNGNLTVWGYVVRVEFGPTFAIEYCGSSSFPCQSSSIIIGLTDPIRNFLSYTISIAAINDAGNGSKALVSDVVCYPPGPRPIFYAPANQSIDQFPSYLHLGFDRPVNLTGPANGLAFQLTPITSGTPPAISINQQDVTSDTSLSLQGSIVGMLQERVKYDVKFYGSNIIDLQGFAGFDINSTQLRWEFTAADITAPTIINSSPRRAEINVVIGLTQLRLIFSEPVSSGNRSVVSIVYLQPPNDTPITRQKISAVGNTDVSNGLDFQLQSGTVHLASATYCVLVDNNAFLDLPPYQNGLVGIYSTSSTDSTSRCFTTSSNLPGYMIATPTPVILTIQLNQVGTATADFSTAPRLEQFKNQVLLDLSTVLGLSIEEINARFRIATITETNFNGNGTRDLLITLDIIDLSSVPANQKTGLPTVSKDPSTLASDIASLAANPSTTWYNPTVVPVLALSSTNFDVASTISIFNVSLSLSITEMKNPRIDVAFRLSGAGAFYIYALVIPHSENAPWKPAAEVVSQITSPSVVCSYQTTQPEQFTLPPSYNSVTVVRSLTCFGTLTEKRRYDLIVAVSSRPGSSLLEEEARSSRKVFTFTTSDIPIETIASGAVLGIAAILWAINMLFFKKSHPNELFAAVVAVLDLFTDCAFAAFLQLQALPTLYHASIAFIIIPIVISIGLVVYIFSHEFSNNPAFVDYVKNHKTAVAICTIFALVRCESLSLLHSHLFDMQILSVTFSSRASQVLRLCNVVAVVTEDIPQIVILLFAVQTLGTFDPLAGLSMAFSFFSILTAIVGGLLELMVTKKGGYENDKGHMNTDVPLS